MWEKARCFRSAHNQRDDTKHTLWAVRASNLPTMRQKRVIAATRGDEVVRRTPFLCRCAFWFFVSASLVFVAAAALLVLLSGTAANPEGGVGIGAGSHLISSGMEELAHGLADGFFVVDQNHPPL